MSGEVDTLIEQNHSDALQRMRVGAAGLCMVAVAAWATVQKADSPSSLQAQHWCDRPVNASKPICNESTPDTRTTPDSEPTPASRPTPSPATDDDDPLVTVVTREQDSDDDDDSGDVRSRASVQPTTRPTPRPTQPPPDSDDDDLTDVVPKVDLPEPVGKATDDVKKIADDALDGTIPLIP